MNGIIDTVIGTSKEMLNCFEFIQNVWLIVMSIENERGYRHITGS